MHQIDNVAIARQLELMADLLEIKGADKFRYLSYRKAASSIRVWPDSLSMLAEQGTLTDISGVGAKLATSITALLADGTFPELEAVQAEFPSGLVEVMQIPGVGPARARRFFDKLGIDSLDALGLAFESGEIARLGGIGEKTAQTIGRGLATHLAHRGRILLGDALPLAEQFAQELRTVPGVEHAEPVGSVRRSQETVDGIEILVAAASDAGVVAYLSSLSTIAQVSEDDPHAVSVLTTSGSRIDVHFAELAGYGSALQRLTGSERHSARLLELAAERGLGAGEFENCATEDEVYGRLGMQVPPPELREDAGEIEAALAGTLPCLLDLRDIRGDFHAHTTSTDSRATLEENRAMAAALGYEYIAVTDHAYDLRMVGGLSVEQLEEQWELVDRLNDDGTDAPVILRGIELNIGTGGRVDYEPDVLRRFDFCIASLHGGWNEDAEAITARLLAAMDNPYVDIIGHPTGRIIGKREPLALDMERVVRKAAETGTILEINAYPDRLDLRDVHVRLAKEHGVRIAIGCDAHRVEHMRYMRYGVATARRGWATPDDCLNAQPIETVRQWLKRTRA